MDSKQTVNGNMSLKYKISIFLNNGRKEGAEVMTEATSILTNFKKKSLFFKELRWLNIYLYMCECACVTVCERPRLHM